MIEHLNTTLFIKNCSYIVAGFLGATGLSHEALIILGVFMILDTITGVAKTMIVNGRQSFTSMRLTSGLISKLLVMLVPLIIAYTGIGIGLDLKFIASASLSILIVAEAYSILGNIHSSVNKKDNPEYDAIGFILEKFRNIVEDFLKRGKK